MIHFLSEDSITLEKMGRDANPTLAPKRWRFLVSPCGEGFARSNEGALSSTGSAWACCVVYKNSVPFQAHHAKKHTKITQYRLHKGLQKFQEGPRWKKKTGNLILRLGALLSRSVHTLWARTWHTMLMTGPGLMPPTDRH